MRVTPFLPGRIIFVSLFFAICIGTFLLALPYAQNTPMHYIDLFFTVTSALTVTGLLTVPLSNFTYFGQCIILCLMQIGGLGIILMTLSLVSLFVELGFSTQLFVGKILELETWKNIKKLLIFIFSLTLIVESVGALFIFSAIYPHFSWPKAFFLSIFHAVSSFCDAGFSVLPYGLVAYQHNYILLITMSLLMLIGGLGFIPWQEIMLFLAHRRAKKRFMFSLHTKIVFHTLFFLIVISLVLFWLLERHNTLSAMSWSESLVNTFFNAISSRSTGFLTVPVNELHVATLFMIMINAFIGSSPGSTGSGIRTTTFAIFLASMSAALAGSSSVQIKGRNIAKDQVLKVLTIIGLTCSWIIMVIFFLLITERNMRFFDVVFEVVSAVATLGISTGITPHLSPAGKLFIIASMIVGRIGPLTLMLALRKKQETREFEYPEERVMLS